MTILVSVLSVIFFICGIVAYWVCSCPLKELPNWHQMQAREQAKK